ncbi:MAG: hypothetical protein D6689_12175 [Deltaproteobacteria bacterium]|nr:MAG: hypothetical protein D6689_12175 [Deltaproteobacteria bacterium]
MHRGQRRWRVIDADAPLAGACPSGLGVPGIPHAIEAAPATNGADGFAGEVPTDRAPPVSRRR